MVDALDIGTVSEKGSIYVGAGENTVTRGGLTVEAKLIAAMPRRAIVICEMQGPAACDRRVGAVLAILPIEPNPLTANRGGKGKSDYCVDSTGVGGKAGAIWIGVSA